MSVGEMNIILSQLLGMQQSIANLPNGNFVDKPTWSSYQDCVKSLSAIDQSFKKFSLNFLNRGDDRKWVTKSEYVSKLNGLVTLLSSLNTDERPQMGFRSS